MLEYILNFIFCSIFGTGIKAQRFFELLCNYEEIQVKCFIVSDEYETKDCFCGKNVKKITDYVQDENEIVLVAVNDGSKHEVIRSLEDRCIKYYFVSEADVLELNRRVHSVIPKSFLACTDPISRFFGLDRGMAIDRYYIESFIKRASASIAKENIKTLEVAEEVYSKEFFPKAVHEVLAFDNGMDLTRHETIRQDYYDLFICTQTLNFIYDVKSAIRGCYSLLKSGGTILATVAGNISQISKYDMDRWGDYWRFTYRSIDMLFREVFGSDVKVYPYGNSMAATAFIQGLCVEDVDTGLLDVSDPEYAIVIGVEARKG